MSMTMAAFTGVSWYIGAEINVSLFVLFKRRRGLYFWACFLGSWGVILQSLFIILADFRVWTDLVGSITMIYLTWLIMVIPQSWVLYSRLDLIVQDRRLLYWLRIVLIFNSIVFSIPTIVIGILAVSPNMRFFFSLNLVLMQRAQQATTVNPTLRSKNIIWDRVQLTVYFVQETVLSLLYIYETRKYVRLKTFLSNPRPSDDAATDTSTAKNRVLWHLIFANLLIIALDIALLGIQYGGDHLFYLQGAFKPCVYGIKLKLEFLVLNRLIDIVRSRHHSTASGSNQSRSNQHSVGGSRLASSKHQGRSSYLASAERGDGEGRQMEGIGEGIGLEPLDRKQLSVARSHDGQRSITDVSTTEGDGRLFGEPTEPWEGTYNATWRR